jgi:hypothetical protein
MIKELTMKIALREPNAATRTGLTRLEEGASLGERMITSSPNDQRETMILMTS